MSDWGISSIAPFCRREESSCCSTEALEALFTTVSWTSSKRGDFSQTEVCSQTKLCGEPKAIPLVDAPIREWNAIEEVSCKGRHTWVGVSRRPGSSDALHHEGKPSASLFGLMESEVLDWKVAGTGSVRCRREPTVSPNTWPAGSKRTVCRGGKTDASPNCQTEEKWGWTISAH